jgi:hypothetical protein
MKNPNGDNFPKDDPMAETEFGGATSGGGELEDRAQRFSSAASQTWDQTRQRATVAREKTEFYLRENPIPTVLGALALGLAIGLLIRYASRPEEPEPVSVRNALKNVDLGALSMPFLWPFFRRVKRGYEDSAEVVTDAMREGIDRVKEVDVDRYVKPLRKQWKSWTR